MEWMGLEIDAGIDAGTVQQGWGPDGAVTPHQVAPDRLMLSGAPGVPSDTLPGALRPLALQRADNGLHLAPLGALPAGIRLRLLGFQELNPQWDGLALICCPDRWPGHSFWATLSAGEVIHLQASMTPALAAALSCDDAPAEGLDEALSRAERLPFTLAEAATPAARLAALIGAEMAAAKALWLGQQAVLVGEGPLARAYLAALQGLYVPVTKTREDMLVREGFRALARAFLSKPDA